VVTVTLYYYYGMAALLPRLTLMQFARKAFIAQKGLVILAPIEGSARCKLQIGLRIYSINKRKPVQMTNN